MPERDSEPLNDSHPDDARPPCVVCGKPGTMGVGHIDRNDEVWYCNDHLDAGYDRAAQP